MIYEILILGVVGFYAWSQGFFALGLVALAVASLILINGIRNP